MSYRTKSQDLEEDFVLPAEAIAAAAAEATAAAAAAARRMAAATQLLQLERQKHQAQLLRGVLRRRLRSIARARAAEPTATATVTARRGCTGRRHPRKLGQLRRPGWGRQCGRRQRRGEGRLWRWLCGPRCKVWPGIQHGPCQGPARQAWPQLGRQL
jgi:hypothetical protein